MTRPEEIAAALERWEKWDCNINGSVGDMIDAGRELARLLRAANPPAGAERATEAKPYRGGLPGAWRRAEPATPAVGEDAKLLEQAEKDAAYLHARNWNDMGFTMQHLASRLTALLAEVARLTEERDAAIASATAERESCEISEQTTVHVAEAMSQQLTEARATLAAVRKVAENYHDVDVTGDPPREVACNPCAAEILNVVEGNYEPRR